MTIAEIGVVAQTPAVQLRLSGCGLSKRPLSKEIRRAGFRKGVMTPSLRRVAPLYASEEKEGETDEPPVVYNRDFGYSRKDVILIGFITIGAGYGLYYGLQFFGMDELQAGSTSQLVVFVCVLMTWVSTYLFRVGSKTTTYVTQLQEYEEAVMQKRLDEMTDAEVEILMEEVEREKREAAERQSNVN